MSINILIDEILSIELFSNIIVSLKNVCLGFIIAFFLAMLIAILLNESKLLNYIFYPILELLRPIPNAGWVPIAIIMFNALQESILFITFIGAFFPMFINIYRALDNIPNNYLIIGKLYKLNTIDKIFKIKIPAIIPHIYTAMMVGVSGSWLSLIMAEMISGKSGLGYYTWKNYTLLNYEKLFIGVIFMGIIGALFSGVISFFSRKVKKIYSLR
ncbi:MAG: ABC transporter permease subunit [Mollicutes bacterium]|nr:ABC transporter permease subunit [Mollicutes bacterium]